MERVVKFLKDAEVFYFKNATATFSAFTHEPEAVKLITREEYEEMSR